MPRKTSTNDDPNYDIVMKLYGNACAICGTMWGVTVHEIVPRSLMPKDWQKISNRLPLCQGHHTYVHNLSKKDREDLLFPIRDRYMKLHTE